jgi:hypothetical protein
MEVDAAQRREEPAKLDSAKSVSCRAGEGYKVRVVLVWIREEQKPCSIGAAIE